VREEENLIAKARASREETKRFRDATLGGESEDDSEVGESTDDGGDGTPFPEKREPEPWAKTSSGDADTMTNGDSS
jgi:hypothetical protein